MGNEYYDRMREAVAALAQSMSEMNYSFKNMIDNLGQLSQTGGMTFNKLEDGFYKLINLAQGMIQGTTTLKELFGSLIGAIGGLRQAILKLSLNPFILGLVTAAATLAAITKGVQAAQERFVELDTAAQSFRENTGFTKEMISDELNAAIVGSSVFAEKSASAAAALFNQYGNVHLVSKEVVKTTVQLSERLGVSEDAAAGFLDKMQNVYGMSAELSRSLAQSGYELAKAAGVPLGAVMEDVRNVSEETLAIMGNHPGKLMSAAVKARQLGLEINKVASIAKGLLDIENSIQAEMEASVLLGRQINMDKARELTMAGDLEGAMKEILAQTGGIAEFNKMNMIQKEAIAKATGMDVATLQRTLAIQDKLNKAGKLNAETQAKISEALRSGNVELAEQVLNENKMDGAVKGRERAMKGAMNQLANAFMDIYKAFRPITDELIKLIPPIAKMIRSLLEGAGITDMIKGWAASIREFIKNIDFAGETFTTIKKVIADLLSFTMKFFGSIFGILKGIFFGGEEEISKSTKKLFESLADFSKMVISAFSWLLPKLGEFLKKFVVNIGIFVLELFNGLWDVAKEYGPKILEFLGNIILDGLKLIKDLLVSSVDFFQYLDFGKVLNGLWDLIKNIKDMFLDGLRKVFRTIIDFFANFDFGSLYSSVYEKIGTFIGRIISMAVQYLWKYFQEMPGILWEYTVKVFEVWGDLFANLPDILLNIAKGTIGVIQGLFVGLVKGLFDVDLNEVISDLGDKMMKGWLEVKKGFLSLIGQELSEEDKLKLTEVENKLANRELQKAELELAKKAEEQQRSNEEKMQEALSEARKNGMQLAEKATEAANEKAKELSNKVDLSGITADKIKAISSIKLTDDQKKSIEQVSAFISQNKESVALAAGMLSTLGDGMKKLGEGMYILSQVKGEQISKNLNVFSEQTKNFNSEEFSAKIKSLTESLITLAGAMEPFKIAFDAINAAIDKLTKVDWQKMFFINSLEQLKKVAEALKSIQESLSKIDMEKYAKVSPDALKNFVDSQQKQTQAIGKVETQKIVSLDKNKIEQETKKTFGIDSEKSVEDIIKSGKDKPEVILLYQILMALKDGLQIDGYKISKGLA